MSGFIARWAMGAILCAFLAVPAAHGEEPATLELTIQDHHFAPSEIHVKAGQPAILVVTNLDGTPEEFEMRQLALEKVIPGGSKARVRIRPLGPGRYKFIGDFHKDLAQGVIISE